MARLKTREVGRYLVVGATGAAACGLSVFLAVNIGAPPTLRAPEPVDEVAVVSQEYSDPHEVEVVVESGSETTLRSIRSGLVTAFTCDASGAWKSGESNVAIDGRPVVNLFTSTPLWRDLGVGARGPDVAALKQELRRLGLDASDGDRVTWTDIHSTRAIASGAGLDEDFDVISAATFVWLPSTSVVPKSCDVNVGDRIAAEEAMRTVQPPVSIRIDADDDMLGGVRQLKVNDLLIDLADDLVPADAAAAGQITSTAAYRSSTAETPTASATVRIGGTVSLKTPVTVSVLPPASVRADTLRDGCVSSGRGIESVTIVSSELGSTFVTFGDAEPPARVKTRAPASCE